MGTGTSWSAAQPAILIAIGAHFPLTPDTRAEELPDAGRSLSHDDAALHLGGCRADRDQSGPAAPAVDAGERAAAGVARGRHPRAERLRPVRAGDPAGLGGAGAGRLDRRRPPRSVGGAARCRGALAGTHPRRLLPRGGRPDPGLAAPAARPPRGPPPPPRGAP